MTPETAARDRARAVLRAGLAAVEPGAAVRRALRREGDEIRIEGEEEPVPLGPVRRVLLVGAGKAARGMAEAALEVLGERVARGVVATTRGEAGALPRIDVWEAGHPVPDVRSLAAAAETLALVRTAARDDLVLCLLSGGASSLWAAPPDGVALDDLRAVTDGLLRAGAPIRELNTVRKHLSRLAGGRLLRAAGEAWLLTLAISDVTGAPPDTIGSGPTLPDPTTYRDAMEVLLRYGVEVPPSVRRHLQAGLAGAAPETLKPGEPAGRSSFRVVAGIGDAARAATAEAERLGYRPTILSDRLEGEAREVARQVAAAVRGSLRGGERVALVWGGETTVTVRGRGRGGRNQELALAAALELAGEPGFVLACMGTDGVDGPTPAAGALVDGSTVERGEAAGPSAAAALDANDSHTFLAAAGDLLVTGPTGTNVGDLLVALVG